MEELVLILGIFNIILIVYRLDIGLYFFTALIPFLPLLPVSGIPALNGTSIIILLLLYKSYSNTAIINRPEILNIPRLNKIIFYLLLWSILSIILSKLFYSHQTYPIHIYFEKLYRWFIYIFLYMVYQRELSSKTKIYYALLALAIGVSAEGLFVAKVLVFTDRIRTYGTIGSVNELGLFFSCYILIQAVFFIYEKRIIYKLLFLGTILLSLLGLSSTLSRGGFLVLFIVTFGFILFKLKKKGVLLILVGSLFSGSIYNILPENVKNRIDQTFESKSHKDTQIGDIELEGSAYSRIPLAKAGLIMFSESPIWGKGFMAYPLLLPRYEYGGQYGFEYRKASHNMHVRMLSELGIIGYILFIIIFYQSSRTGIKLYKNREYDKKENDLGAILFLINIGFLVGCLFGDRFFRGVLITYYFVISAACFNLLVINESKKNHSLVK